MAGEISTIQSLKAVDAWIDVINANINGGVRTAFKSSRLKFAGGNSNVDRAGTTTSLPLQFPEASLTTANTVIDFTQGAVTASTEVTHLAIQGEGFFVLARPDIIQDDPTTFSFGQTILVPPVDTTGMLMLTRDGEFHTAANGLLMAANGYYLVTADVIPNPFNPGQNILLAGGTTRAVYNDLEAAAPPAGFNVYVNLSVFMQNDVIVAADGSILNPANFTDPTQAIVKVPSNKQDLTFSKFGSTVFNYAFQTDWATFYDVQSDMTVELATTADATILGKSLEASNASMTQSVPELSLAQKLFSALTKVLQTKQTNVDGVLNLVR